MITAEEDGECLESANAIWAPHSVLSSAPPQASRHLSPQALASPRESVTLARGGGVAAETQSNGKTLEKLWAEPLRGGRGRLGFEASRLLRLQSHQVLPPAGPGTLALLRPPATGLGIWRPVPGDQSWEQAAQGSGAAFRR